MHDRTFSRTPPARITLGLVVACLICGPAVAQQPVRHHALSLIGKPQYSADYQHFDWVNPNAPKGGTVRRWMRGTFDSLNPFTFKGVPATRLGLLYDSLMATSPDEPSTEYGLVAEWASYPDDFSSVTFGLRKEAKFHDGKPVTPDDVVFSLGALKKSHPQYAFYYKNVVKAEKTGEHEVTFTFDVKGNRELPQIVGQLYVLPKHFWEGKKSDGTQRDLSKSTLEVPVGSGPYKIKSVDAGRAIVYERNPNYWAKDLPVNVGQWNFDEIRFDYFRDRTPAFEAFKSGSIDFWEENVAKAWATQYNIAPVKKGLMKKEAIAHKRVAPMQAFVLNQRRNVFKDARVRKAFNLAFNFEQANKTLFYDLYVRTKSFFDNSELAATDLPTGKELEILNEIRDQVPPEVFTTKWKNVTASSSIEQRNNLREAVKLLRQAGWTQKNGSLVNADGDVLKVEFLYVQPTFDRVILAYIEDLKRIGIQATARLVDSTQYKRRIDQFDFDVIIDAFGQSHSPGNEQRDFWGSAAADREGSQNTPGIKDPAVDKLIDRIVFAKDRAELVAATRALDRVLLWNAFVVPHWNYPFERLVWWDKFGKPNKLPSLAASPLRTWWFDQERDAALKTARGT